MKTSSSSTYAAFFSHLASALKAQIISKLKDSEMSVGELSESMKIEQSKLSHALASLRECNLVVVKKEGKSRIYSLNKKTLLPILDIIDQHARSFCSENCWACVGCSQQKTS